MAILLRDGDRRAQERLFARPGYSLISVISRVELEGGVYSNAADAPARRRRLDDMLEGMEVLPFGSAEADAYRHIVEACGFSRSRILDRMIGATALVARLELATLNPRDFRDIPELRVEDWSR